MSTGMKSLMKYRYQPRQGATNGRDSPQSKPGPSSSSSESSQSSTSSQNGSQNGSIPNTQESKPLSTESSPVFEAKKPRTGRGAVTVIDSDSDDNVQSVASTAGSLLKKSSSPWLSKEIGKLNGHDPNLISRGGGVKRPAQSDSESPTSSRSSSLSSHTPLTSTDREFHSNLSHLRSMFPGHPTFKLEKALHITHDLEKAIDVLISGTNLDLFAKTQRTLSSQSSILSTDSEPIRPPARKRIRQLTDSDDEAVQSSQDTVIMEKHDENSEHMAFLTDAFPKLSNVVLRTMLKRNDDDVELTAAALGSISDEQIELIEARHKPVSQVKNMGSIKGYKAQRLLQAKAFAANADDPVELSDDDDVLEVDPVEAEKVSKLKKKKKKRKNKEVIDLDSGDEVVDLSSEEDSEDEAGSMPEKDASPILNFLNNAQLEELVMLPGCSKKKAEVIIEIRPFSDWTDMRTKLEENRSLNVDLITSCKDLLKIREIVTRLMLQCEKISENIECIVHELSTMTSMEDGNSQRNSGDRYIITQPSKLNPEMTLKPYQMVGLNWLMLMHTEGINGILADEMGLGKTIQTIAFLAQMLGDGERGPHVIIAPSSTLDNWLRELQLWCPDLKVLLYYGSQEERREMRSMVLEGTMEEFHVLLTTYNMATGSNEDRAMFKKHKFHYAVFDEGHMLKNMSSLRYQNLMKIRAKRRLLLTGTPLQNNLLELMSLLCFVMPEIFIGKTDHLKRMFTAITGKGEGRSSYESECINRAKGIMKPFFLRRIKAQVLQQLTKKEEIVERVPMAFEQQDLYDDLVHRFSQKVKEDGDSVFRRGGASMLMDLRKAANHHLLHRRQFDETRLRQMAELMLQEPTHREANEQYIYEDMEVMTDYELHRLCKQYLSINQFKLDDDSVADSGKFRLLDELLPAMKEKGERVLLFSQFTMMLDIVQDYMRIRHHKFIRLDGSTPVAERQGLIDRYNNDKSIFMFLLSTRAGGMGINLTAANVVLIHDIDFNPYNDKQAEDRCHRVGQTRAVRVYRLISRGTVEEAMFKCAKAKLQLEADVTGIGAEKDEDNQNDVASLLRQALSMETSDS